MGRLLSGALVHLGHTGVGDRQDCCNLVLILDIILWGASPNITAKHSHSLAL